MQPTCSLPAPCHGSTDYPDEVLISMDFAIMSCHSTQALFHAIWSWSFRYSIWSVSQAPFVDMSAMQHACCGAIHQTGCFSPFAHVQCVLHRLSIAVKHFAALHQLSCKQNFGFCLCLCLIICVLQVSKLKHPHSLMYSLPDAISSTCTCSQRKGPTDSATSNGVYSTPPHRIAQQQSLIIVFLFATVLDSFTSWLASPALCMF